MAYYFSLFSSFLIQYKFRILTEKFLLHFHSSKIILSAIFSSDKSAVFLRRFCLARKLEQGNAIQLSVVLFLSAYNRCTNGSTAADKQQSNPQQKIGVISRLRRLVGAGFDGAAGQLCRYGLSLGDFLCVALASL